MARGKKSRTRAPGATGPLPPPLPPETRTVGQVIAEAIRFYRQNFWQTLPLGISVALLTQIAVVLSSTVRPSQGDVYGDVLDLGATRDEAARIAAESVVAAPGSSELTAAGRAFVALGIPLLLTLSYVAASRLVGRVQLGRRRALVAYAIGLVAAIPVPFLGGFLGILSALPVVAWLAFVGLAVPAAVIEGTAFRASFARATQLARADYVHAVGSLAALVVVYFVTRYALLMLLRTGGEATERTASLLADLVLSPLLFVGAVLVYFDQAARVGRRRDRGRSQPAKPARAS